MLDKLKTQTTKYLRQVLKLLSIGTFHENRVVFFSYFGNQYSCNPKYISEYIIEHHLPFHIVWAFKNPSEYNELKKKGITLTKYLSLPFLRICLTSKYIITNSEIPSWFPVTNRQTLINTWHGGGAYKRVGAAYQKETAEKQKRAAIARETPCIYLSSSKAFTEMTLKQSFHHRGEVIEQGMPRNDILVNQDKPKLYAKIRAYYSLPSDCKILLYAPTYRDSKKVSEYLFDCETIRQTLTDTFGGNWVILFRMHYFVMEQLPHDLDYIDASQYPDMQELLYASDILITDYSSSMWDFALTGKPCFLYATDLNQYDLKRGFYTDIHSWPYPLAEDTPSLIDNIIHFSQKQYTEDLQKHFLDLGSYETGRATQAVIEYMLK